MLIVFRLAPSKKWARVVADLEADPKIEQESQQR
jgi:hypothetical protein